MERKRKKLQELTIKDNFMFAAVMLDEENAKGLLELVLGLKIDHVEVTPEKSIVYNPEYKGVRLDVFLKDEKGTHFNVEMQATSQKLEKRARYYHSQIDMELLASGVDYEELPDSYVIFICDYDPLHLKKYKYTIRQVLAEEKEYVYTDGSHTVFLSTVGTNKDEVPEALVKFLKFVAAGLESSEDDYDDEYVKRLQDTVKKIKISRDMEARYMLLEEMKKIEYRAGLEDGRIEGRNEGKIEGRIDSITRILNSKFTVSDDLSELLNAVDDSEELDRLLLIAVSANDEAEFKAGMNL